MAAAAFEGLTQTSRLDDGIEPLLARSWERSDDGFRWVLRLRDDVKWHDGTPLAAHDVEFRGGGLAEFDGGKAV